MMQNVLNSKHIDIISLYLLKEFYISDKQTIIIIIINLYLSMNTIKYIGNIATLIINSLLHNIIRVVSSLLLYKMWPSNCLECLQVNGFAYDIWQTMLTRYTTHCDPRLCSRAEDLLVIAIHYTFLSLSGVLYGTKVHNYIEF